MLFAIGAGPQVVGVSSFDKFPPEVKKLPRVGALLDPDTERILSLRPDLVIIYGSQTDLQTQFARAGIRTFIYRHGGIDTIFQTMRELGDATGQRRGRPRRDAISRHGSTRVRARVKGRPRPRTLLVFERQPKTLREHLRQRRRRFPARDARDRAAARNVFADVDARVGAAVARDADRPRAGGHPRGAGDGMLRAVGHRRRRGRAGRRCRRCRPSATAACISWSASTSSCPGRGSRRPPRRSPARCIPEALQMKILLSWSSGKDSAWALHVLNRQHPGAVAALLTTVNEAMDRVAMHGVRRDVLEAQARAARLPLRVVDIPHPCPNEVYEAADGRGGRRGGRRRVHARRVRRSVPRGRPRATARSGSRAPGSSRSSRSGTSRRGRSPASMIAGGLRARLACVDTRVLDAAVRRPRVRRLAARRSAGTRRPVRRERRVPHLRLRRPDVSRADGARDRDASSRAIRSRGRI